ncbi:hypothetical protein PUN28_011538 [Cardiocondyla obscurior]|uniref:Uncharacterized protein n=1 Tax=Cardiocondyla obscurior TaxID=286306 RepID=A0AAW2FFU4_9HYME
MLPPPGTETSTRSLMEIQKRTGEGRSARQLTDILRGGAGPGRVSGIGRATFSHRQYLQLCWYHAVG